MTEQGALQIDWYEGDREILRTLFLEAEDSHAQLDSYINEGQVLVATAAADIGNLRFYQRCGFRFSAIERDAFGPDSGYPEPIVTDGIPLRDRVWLDRPVSRTGTTEHGQP